MLVPPLRPLKPSCIKDFNEHHHFEEVLSEALNTMSDLDNCMLFDGDDREISKPAMSLPSLVKKAQTALQRSTIAVMSRPYSQGSPPKAAQPRRSGEPRDTYNSVTESTVSPKPGEKMELAWISCTARLDKVISDSSHCVAGCCGRV